MRDLLIRQWTDIIARLSGPMSFRFLLQPCMALFFAFRDGILDSREGKPPYFWSLFTDSLHRFEIVRSGWKSIAKVFIAAFIIDCIYQIIVLRWIYPGEALLVAILLAILPYLFTRGPVNRIVRYWSRKRSEN